MMTTPATTPADGVTLEDEIRAAAKEAEIVAGMLPSQSMAHCASMLHKRLRKIERSLAADRRATPSPGKAPERKKLDDDLLATIREAAKTRAEGAITQDGLAVFINYGESEQQMLDAKEMACPHCCGSGHKDDASPGKAEAERWQPIETAPKDGTEIWAFSDGEQVRMQWISGDGYALWSYADPLLSDVCPEGGDPTHWMPLPSPPNS